MSSIKVQVWESKVNPKEYWYAQKPMISKLTEQWAEAYNTSQPHLKHQALGYNEFVDWLRSKGLHYNEARRTMLEVFYR